MRRPPCSRGCLYWMRRPASARQPGVWPFSRPIALSRRDSASSISPNTQVSVSVLPLLFAAVVFGPLAAMLVGAFAMLADFGAPFTRWIIWTASRALVGGSLASRRLLSSQTALRSWGCSWASVLLALSRRRLTSPCSFDGCGPNEPLPDVTHSTSRVVFGTVSLYAPIIAILVYAYASFRLGLSYSFSCLRLLRSGCFVLYQEQRRSADDLAKANGRLEALVSRSPLRWLPLLMLGISIRRAIRHVWPFMRRTSPRDSACPRNSSTPRTSLGLSMTSESRLASRAAREARPSDP